MCVHVSSSERKSVKHRLETFDDYYPGELMALYSFVLSILLSSILFIVLLVLGVCRISALVSRLRPCFHIVFVESIVIYYLRIDILRTLLS